MTDLPSNLWKSPVIQARLTLEANFECDHGISERAHYWVLAPYADSKDGTTILKNYPESLQTCNPHELQQDFARQIQHMLQTQAHFDGCWLVGYTHPPTVYGVITDTDNCWNRFIAIWHDADGDPQYTVETDFPFNIMLEHGVEYYVGLAHDAHSQWIEVYSDSVLKSDMMLKEDQQTKAALEALN